MAIRTICDHCKAEVKGQLYKLEIIGNVKNVYVYDLCRVCVREILMREFDYDPKGDRHYH